MASWLSDFEDNASLLGATITDKLHLTTDKAAAVYAQQTAASQGLSADAASTLADTATQAEDSGAISAGNIAAQLPAAAGEAADAAIAAAAPALGTLKWVAAAVCALAVVYVVREIF